MGPSMTGARASLPLWTDIMKAYYRDRPAEPFVVPEGIVYRVICEKSGALSAPKCTHVRREAFVDGTEPHGYCDREESSIDAMSSFDDYENLERVQWENN
jgi:membrane carboxypeptidase/penicillin-binding protein